MENVVFEDEVGVGPDLELTVNGEPMLPPDESPPDAMTPPEYRAPEQKPPELPPLKGLKTLYTSKTKYTFRVDGPTSFNLYCPAAGRYTVLMIIEPDMPGAVA